MVLTSDLMNCLGDGIVIGANGITLDLNGHAVSGDGVPGISALTLGSGTTATAASQFEAAPSRRSIAAFSSMESRATVSVGSFRPRTADVASYSRMAPSATASMTRTHQATRTAAASSWTRRTATSWPATAQPTTTRESSWSTAPPTTWSPPTPSPETWEAARSRSRRKYKTDLRKPCLRESGWHQRSW